MKNEQQVPAVSVVMPAYNAAAYIRQAIESILAQTLQDFELIILDDCSTDGTWSIVQAYAQREPRIVAVRNDKNLGIAGNRNKGVSLARGKFLAWQDADDISLPTRLEKQCRYLAQYPQVGIVGGFLQFFDERGFHGVRRYAAEDAELRKHIFRYSPVAQPAAMIRKQCLDEAGQYDLRYPPAEDIDMSFRIGQSYKFANLQEIVVQYRKHASSATFTRLRKIELSTMEIRRRFWHHPSYHPTFMDRIYNRLQYWSIFFIPSWLKIALFNYFRNS